MRIFLYEHLTAGAAWSGAQPPPPSLLAEGLAMVRALGEDLAQEHELLLLRDARLDAHLPGSNAASFNDAIAWADATILIAPETDQILQSLAQQVEQRGGRLFSPSSAFVAIAADKECTATTLATAGVPVPLGGIWRPGERLAADFPAVVKPMDGCGSQDVRLVRSTHDLPTIGTWRLEAFCPGQAASVAILCGPGGNFLPLPACTQRLSSDGNFAYLGGSLPLPEVLARRAQDLAIRAVEALSQLALPLGYVGVDLILGDDQVGSGDLVIEVNPRLTTSYAGLRAACRSNLGAAQVRYALGENVAIEFASGQLEFEANGDVRRLSPSPGQHS